MAGNQRKSTKKAGGKSLRSTVSLVLVLLLVFAVNYFMGDPMGVMKDAAEAPAAATATPSHVSGAPTQAPDETKAPERTKTPEKDPAKTPLEGTLEAYVLEVGQGDSIFFRSPSGKTMLVDASDRSNEIYDKIDQFLKAKGVTKLDVVIATHPHADHIGNMQKVVENYEIGAYYMPDAVNNTKMFERLLTALKERKVPVKKAEAGKDAMIPWDDDVEIRILSPFAGYEYKDLNDTSIICRVKFGDTAIMLTGDAEAYAEKISLSELPADYFKADVLKLGHHGSSSSTSSAFLAAVAPDLAIASLAKDNDYGHPHREIIAAMKEAGIPFYRTDESGIVKVIMDGTKVQVETEK